MTVMDVPVDIPLQFPCSSDLFPLSFPFHTTVLLVSSPESVEKTTGFDLDNLTLPLVSCRCLIFNYGIRLREKHLTQTFLASVLCRQYLCYA